MRLAPGGPGARLASSLAHKKTYDVGRPFRLEGTGRRRTFLLSVSYSPSSILVRWKFWNDLDAVGPRWPW